MSDNDHLYPAEVTDDDDENYMDEEDEESEMEEKNDESPINFDLKNSSGLTGYDFINVLENN